MTNSTTAIIILAAGSSSRLGLPKQLLQLHDKSLLRHSVEVALAAQAAEAVVILGFEADRMRHEIDDLTLRIVVNPTWQEGIASSIREGISSLPLTIDAALLSLCDQPFVTSELLGQLIAVCSEPQNLIAAAEYNNTVGVPACFSRSLFPELLELRGDAGAKRIIELHRQRTVAVPFPQASIDIDTLEDYRKHLGPRR